MIDMIIHWANPNIQKEDSYKNTVLKLIDIANQEKYSQKKIS